VHLSTIVIGDVAKPSPGARFNAMASGPEGTEKEFRYITCRWLRFAGRLQEPARPPTPHQAELDA
jgi:hypothetical protein